MKKIQVVHEGKTYKVNIEQAIANGSARELNKKFTLILDEDEAAVLRELVRAVGGPPEGARGKINRISDKLSDLGDAETDLDLSFDEKYGRNTIYFK